MEPDKVIVQTPSPPAYKGYKVRQSPLLVAVGVACACGTGLVVVSIIGGIWLNDLKGQVAQGTMDKTVKTGENGGEFERIIKVNIIIDNEDRSMSETVKLDKVKNEEVELQYGDNEELEYVGVMDFATNIYGSYSVAENQCYIYHSGEHKYDNVDDMLDTVYDGDAESQDIHYNSSRLDFFMDKKPITDHSILPDNLKPYCEGKEVYWLRAMEKCGDSGMDEKHDRQKRAIYDCYFVLRCCDCYGYSGCRNIYKCFLRS